MLLTQFDSIHMNCLKETKLSTENTKWKKKPKQLFLKLIPNNVNIIDCIQLKITLKIEDILSY